MSADLVSATKGIITLKVSGKLTQPELDAVQEKALAGASANSGKCACLYSPGISRAESGEATREICRFSMRATNIWKRSPLSETRSGEIWC